MTTPDQAIEQEIQAKGKTAARVTPADIEANIASEHYFTAADGAFAADDGPHSEVANRRNIPDALNCLTFCVLVLKNGFTVTGESACASPENFDAEIVMLISYGQSNSVGTDGQPALTTSQAYDNLSFAGGVRPGDLAVGSPLGSFIPLVERDKPNTTDMGETPIGGATIAIKDLVAIENGIAYTQQTYQLLGVANGAGGAPIASLEKGTAQYNVLLSHVTAAKAVPSP